jgi:hypothetical protein
MIRLHAHPFPPFPVSKLDQRPTVKPREKEWYACMTGRGGLGAESYDSKKAWPSKNHSILSAGVGEVPTSVNHEGNTRIMVTSSVN